MSGDDILARLHRIYAAIDAVLESDLTKFPPHIFQDETHFAMYQDFIGGLTPAELTNLAYSVIHNVANLRDHLRRWAVKNGHNPSRIDQAISRSMPLQIITDLSNNDKHGYPPRNAGHSGKAPQLTEIQRVLCLTTAAEAGSSVRVILTSSGPKQVSGSGSTSVAITGQVVDAHGTVIGDLYDIEVEALKAWEQELKDLGILT
jgi:hypothetical protein